MGAPGAGKGTQAERLANELGAPHLDTGALLREAAGQDSQLAVRVGELINEGRLVPDDLTDQIVAERLSALPADQGFVLDGYPRNVRQARALRRLLGELGRLEQRPVFVYLDVPRDALVERLRRRGRSDDTDDVIARRLDLYDEETAPLRDAVGEWADVVAINGDQPPDAVADQVLRAVLAKGPRPAGEECDSSAPITSVSDRRP
jgi:adenylate kinase